MNVRERVDALREQMRRKGLTAYLIPSTDAHQSEYVPACWRRRAWISGFTGSAGELLVTLDGAGLWTDGRYFLQASQQLKGSGIQLFKMGQPGVPTLHEHLTTTLKEGQALGVDPRLLSLQGAQELKEAVEGAGAKLRTVDTNLVDRVWKGRPRMPRNPVRILPRRFAGESVSSKLRRLRKAMAQAEVEAHVLTTLDSIAWLFNIRGTDVAFNPLVIAYAIVTHEGAELFVAPGKVSAKVAEALASDVTGRPYARFGVALREWGKRKARVWVDGGTVSHWVAQRLRGARLHTEASPIVKMKAAKNPTEQDGMRAAHVRDGVAMVRFLHWLQQAVPGGQVSELSAADQLAAFRADGEHFRGLSFETISAYAEHGAIIHYGPDENSDVYLEPDGIYLIDSGGQYLDGTTDVTRTVLLGRKATAKQKDLFTRVLKGHIALARTVFPAGVRGMRLDTLARLSLWEAGLDYNHGTGHGVGAHLNVHEGPQAISPGRCIGVPLEAGNVQSNEPGFYVEGEYGIRIENLIMVVPEEKLSRGGKTFYRFETLTLCPIDRRLIDVKLLTDVERKWVDDYHRRVYQTLSPRVEPPVKRWLKEACARL